MEEFLARLRLSKCFLTWAWLSLWSPSLVTSAVFFNSVREEGDGLITMIKDNGKVYDLTDKT